jgi:CheY-like chemotaxis protein
MTFSVLTAEMVEGDPGLPYAARMQSPLSALLIDDDPDSLYVYGRILERAGFRVRTADRPAVGLTDAQLSSPSVIVLDIHFPDVSGMTLRRMLDQDQSTAHIPIVALTNVAEQVPQQERFAFAAFLVKPCDPQTFVRVVERCARDAADAPRAAAPTDAISSRL